MRSSRECSHLREASNRRAVAAGPYYLHVLIQGLLTHVLIRERLATVQRSSSDQLSGDTAILKEYLKSKGVPSEASEELDTLRRDTGKGWRAAVAKISELPED